MLSSLLIVSTLTACGAPLNFFASTSTTDANNGGSNNNDETPTTPTTTNFTSGQAALVVLGQSSFTSSGTGTTRSTLNHPYWVDVDASGVIRIADTSNNRVMGFNSLPATSGADADFVLGQSDFTSNGNGNTAHSYRSLWGVHSASGKVAVTDTSNDRVLIYNSAATSGNPDADVAVGSNSTSSAGAAGTTATTLSEPSAAFIAGSKLLIAEATNNRIAIYNTIPTSSGAAADLVLGQTDFTSSTANAGASGISRPYALWSDGTRVIVSDSGNNRILIWNTFPTANGQAADVVVGQPDMTSNSVNQGGTPSAQTLQTPWGVSYDGTKLYVADCYNHRVLIWNSLPTTNNQAADVVLGQTNFTSVSANGGGSTSSTVQNYPMNLISTGGHLYLADWNNSRVLVY